MMRAVVPLAALVLLAACGSSGTELRDPATGATAPTQATVAPQASTASTGPAFFTVSSPTISPGGEIPSAYTCSGEDVSPPFVWSSVPTAAVELALVVTATPPEDEVLWVISGLSPTSEGIGEGLVPDGAVESLNSSGTTGWSGPCPASGLTTSYEITAYAFFDPLAMEPGLPADEALTLVRSVISSPATMTALYTGD
jgi:phosphatidylethanolamine-binding protein (PEBP) family uncharacterized protein